MGAEEFLLQKSLVEKSAENGTIRMHKPVQKVVLRRMTIEERQEILSVLIDTLILSLPDTYSSDVGHQVASWAQSERSVPHIENIIKQNEDFGIFRENNQSFAELLLRYCWYVLEAPFWTSMNLTKTGIYMRKKTIASFESIWN